MCAAVIACCDAPPVLDPAEDILDLVALAVPVHAITSDLSGGKRVAWAIEASFTNNKKNTLNISGTDKADGAWRAVRDGEQGSKSDTARAFGVAPSTIANMRRTLRLLGDTPPSQSDRPLEQLHQWGSAQRELKDRDDNARDGDKSDFLARRKIEAAKRLKGVMDLHLPPGELANALENYEPGIVRAMNAALGAQEDEEEEDEWDGSLPGV